MKAPGIAEIRLPNQDAGKSIFTRHLSLLQNYKYFNGIYDYNMLYFLCL